VVARFTEAQTHRIKPVVVKSGPVKEVVLTGDRTDLRSLPIVTHCEKDAGPYISAGVTIMRDPSSGALNAGIYRNRVLSPTRLTMNMAPLCHASQITEQAEARKEHVEAAIARVVTDVRRRWPTVGRVAAIHRIGHESARIKPADDHGGWNYFKILLMQRPPPGDQRAHLRQCRRATRRALQV